MYKESLLKCLMTLKTYQISRRCSVGLGLVCSDIVLLYIILLCEFEIKSYQGIKNEEYFEYL